jgi:threonine dehydrogenase-like Zn-dependent dehydrogenase
VILAKIPDDLRDEQVVLLADIASPGISAAESANLKIGDAVAVFAQGTIGLCVTAGAKLTSASFIIGIESDPFPGSDGGAYGRRCRAQFQEMRRRRGD